MTNDVDTLAAALYVKTDDLLKQAPHLAPRRPTTGIEPRLPDAELVTLAVLQALLGCTSESRWLRHAYAHLGPLFRYLPQQPGCVNLLAPLAAAPAPAGRPAGLTARQRLPGAAAPVQPARRGKALPRSARQGGLGRPRRSP